MGDVLLWGIEFRVQDAGARRVGNAEGMRGIVRKHDCALPAQYTKHSNARGHSFRYYRVISKALLGFSVPDRLASMTAHYNPNIILT